MFLNLFKNKNFIYLIYFCALGVSCNLKTNEKNSVNQSQLNQFIPDKFNSNYQNYNQKIALINKLNQTIVNFNIAIADNPEKQATGLMHLKSLPNNLGMLFLKNQPQIFSMWMKNTYIPLDMIFLDKDFTITKIHHNAQPLSLEIISSNHESLAVLELNGGLANKFQLKIGDSLKFIN
jgi:uncharacterized membrane protein (UPF0127 family)